MMLIHLVGGTAVVVLTVAAGVVYATGRQRARLAAVAAWALALLVVQAATGMFLLTASDEGPGPVHVVLPLVGLAVVAGSRLLGSQRVRRPDGWLAGAHAVAAVAAIVALLTGLAAG